MRRLFRQLRFKNQIMLFVIPMMIVFVLVIGIFVYQYGLFQVRHNSMELMANTTYQTAQQMDNKLNLLFTQSNQLNDQTNVWRLVNHTYKEEKSAVEYQDIIALYNDLNDIYRYNNEMMDSIAFSNAYGNHVTIYKDMVYETLTLDLNKGDLTKQKENYGFSWLNKHSDHVFPTPIDRQVISLVMHFKNSANKQVGAVIFNLKADYFEAMLQEIVLSDNGYIMVVSEDGILNGDMEDMENPYGLTEEQIKTVLKQKESQGSLAMNSYKTQELMDVYYSKLQTNSWKVISVVPRKDLFSLIQNFRLILLLILAGSVILAILIGRLCSAAISNPVEDLSSQVRAFEKDRDHVFEVTGAKEIQTLALGLNHLKASVDQLLTKVTQEQMEKTDMEIRIMQSQIRPHFLYNTLTSIRHLIEFGDAEAANRMCLNLIQFYKVGLSNGHEVITLKEEVEHIRHYLEIQSLRYEESFDYDIQLDPSLYEIPILRLTLQPIVENAIYHGIKQKDTKGIIAISCYKEEGYLVMNVFDDGVGMTPQQVANLKEGITQVSTATVKDGGFGLWNVWRRLTLFYGTDLSIQINSAPNVYTEVQIRIPINMNTRSGMDVSSDGR